MLVLPSQDQFQLGAGLASNLGRREKVASCSDNDGATPLNEVQFVYNDLGALTREYQEHAGAVVTGTSPYVEYSFDDSADGSSVYTKGMRLKMVRYPDGRLLHYTYGGSGFQVMGEEGTGGRANQQGAEGNVWARAIELPGMRREVP